MSYYSFITDIKTFLLDRGHILTVTEGRLTDEDLEKYTDYPLAHIVVQDISLPIEGGINVFNISVFMMQPTEEYDSPDAFGAYNNRIHILNTLLVAAEEFVLSGKYGSLSESIEFVEGSFSVIPFTERFENLMTGYEVSASIAIPRTSTIC